MDAAFRRTLPVPDRSRERRIADPTAAIPQCHSEPPKLPLSGHRPCGILKDVAAKEADRQTDVLIRTRLSFGNDRARVICYIPVTLHGG